LFDVSGATRNKSDVRMFVSISFHQSLMFDFGDFRCVYLTSILEYKKVPETAA